MHANGPPTSTPVEPSSLSAPFPPLCHPRACPPPPPAPLQLHQLPADALDCKMEETQEKIACREVVRLLLLLPQRRSLRLHQTASDELLGRSQGTEVAGASGRHGWREGVAVGWESKEQEKPERPMRSNVAAHILRPAFPAIASPPPLPSPSQEDKKGGGGRRRRERGKEKRKGEGRAGQGRAGRGKERRRRAGQAEERRGEEEQGRAGQGRAGQGRAGQAEERRREERQGRAGQGRAGRGEERRGEERRSRQDRHSSANFSSSA
eukprot:768337-Hanusia_phi.AAC.1